MEKVGLGINYANIVGRMVCVLLFFVCEFAEDCNGLNVVDLNNKRKRLGVNG